MSPRTRLRLWQAVIAISILIIVGRLAATAVWGMPFRMQDIVIACILLVLAWNGLRQLRNASSPGQVVSGNSSGDKGDHSASR